MVRPVKHTANKEISKDVVPESYCFQTDAKLFEDNISLCWHLPEVFVLYILKGFQVPYGHKLLKIFSVDKEQPCRSYKLLYREDCRASKWIAIKSLHQ